jgi:hypothetical protein
MSRPLLDQTLGSLNYEEEDRTLRSFEYGEERKNGDRCENCIRRGTRCVRVLRTLAAANACQACRSSRIRCSFVADRKKKERGSNPDLTLEQKSPLRLSPSFEAERQSKITALMGHPGDGVLVDFDGNDTTGWASIPRNTPQNSENSGNQTIGGSSSSHGHSHEVDEIITEQARQLAIAYAPLPLSFRKHSTTFEIMSGVVIAVNDKGGMMCSGGWQRWVPQRTVDRQNPDFYDTLPCSPDVWFEVNAEGTVFASCSEALYFSTLWKDYHPNSHLGDFANGSSNYGPWQSWMGSSPGSIDSSIESPHTGHSA